jgi:hypothetical protein
VAKKSKKSKKSLNVEIYGWYVSINVRDVSKRPQWEIRVNISRSKENRRERRGHRFNVAPELSEKLSIDKWSDTKRKDLFSQAAKKVIIRDFHEIFAEPEDGLDSLRPLTEDDLTEQVV